MQLSAQENKPTKKIWFQGFSLLYHSNHNPLILIWMLG